MFCYQRSFGLPTEVITKEQFWAILQSPETIRKVKEAREALARGDKNAYDNKKKGLPLMIFIGTFDESAKIVKDIRTGKDKCVYGGWRLQKYCRLNGLVVADYDHLDGDPREIWAAAYAKLSDEEKARIVLVYVTPSSHGLKVVFMANPAIGNLIDNVCDLSLKLGLTADASGKDGSRGAFMTTADDIISINEEQLFTYENKEFIERYNALYRDGYSQATHPNNLGTDSWTSQAAKPSDRGLKNKDTVSSTESSASQKESRVNPCQIEFNGKPISEIIDKWMEGVDLANNRHNTLVDLASHLRYIIGKNAKKITEVVLTLPWVQELQAEGEDVAGTVRSVMDFKYREYMPKKLKGAIDAVSSRPSDSSSLSSRPNVVSGEISQMCPEAQAASRRDVSTTLDMTKGGGALGITNVAEPQQDDVYDQLPLDKWAEELLEMSEYYPCMKELFVNVHPHKLPAVLFSSAALFGTLMTRAWYHFWFAPKIIRRLNYCIFIIGDPGAGKHMIEEFYKIIADPIIQADQCMTDALNRYKESRTERTTSTKAQKADALKKPEVGIRVHPARTATGEFIRHMLAAKEMIEGQPLNLHMLSFDSELDNVNKNNKGGDWKDREILELKAFHNEEDGQMYANTESISGMFNVYWNFIYTGTPYALHRKVNQRNFGTGMSTRLAVIPLPDKGTALRNQEVIEGADETLRQWAYRLDQVKGEIPIEPLNDETYEWQTAKMEIAEFNHDKADRMLLKRIPYYGIGITLPFILMRHWQEWQEHHTLTMDNTDKRFCRTVMEIQYQSQKFFFGEMAFNYFADQNKEFVVRKRTTRYQECFSKLPDEFKTQQYVECFKVTTSAASRALARFVEDGIVEKVKMGFYRKLLKELP